MGQTRAHGTHVRSGPVGSGMFTVLRMFAAGPSDLGHYTTGSPDRFLLFLFFECRYRRALADHFFVHWIDTEYLLQLPWCAPETI